MAVSLYDIRRILNPSKRESPTSTLKIIDSWTEYVPKGSTNERPLDYLCYELESIDPETGERFHYYKAIKFARVIRIPKSAKQSTALMDMHAQVLSAVYEQNYNFITVIANIREPVALGLLFLYGVQGIGSSIDEAKARAHKAFNGLIYTMQGTYRVLELRPINAQETEWLREKIYSMEYLTVVRGIPKANESGEDMGNKGMGGKNLNPDSQGTLEEIITGMADYEYVIQVLTSPVYQSTLRDWAAVTRRDMTDWYEQMQGTKGFSFNLSIPMMYAANQGTSQGWNKGYTNAESVNYSQGESFNTSYGENVGQSLSQSFGQSFGRAYGQSFSESISQTHTISQGITTGRTVGVSMGTSQGVSIGQSSGTSQSQSYGQNIGVSQGQSFGESVGRSQGTSFGQNIGQSFGQSMGQSFGQSLGVSTGQNVGTSIGQNQGTSVSQGVGQSYGRNVGESFGTSQNYGQSLGSNVGTSHGVSSNVSHGVSSGQSMGYSQGQSYSYGQGTSMNSGHSLGMSQNMSVGQSAGTSQSTGVSVGTSHSASQNQSAGWSQGVNASASQGTSQSVGTSYSENMGWNSGANAGSNVSHSESHNDTHGWSGGASISPLGIGLNGGGNSSHSDGYSDSIGYSGGVSSGVSGSVGYGTSASVGESASHSVGVSQGLSGSVSQGESIGQSASQSASVGINQGVSSSHGVGTSESFSASVGNSMNESWGVNQSTSSSNSISNSYSQGYGQSLGTSEGYSQGFSTSQGQSYGQNVGQSYGQSMNQSVSQNQGQSYSQSYGQSYGQNYGQSTGQNYGTSQGQSVGQSMGTSEGSSYGQNVGQSYGTSQGQSIGQSMGVSTGMSYGQSQGTSQSVSNSQSYSVSQSESYSVSHGYTKGESYTESTSESSSTGSTQSVGQSKSIGQGTSTSTGRGTSQSLSNGYSAGLTSGASSSMGLAPSVGYSKSYQWLDQQVKDIIEMLEYQNERIKNALRGNGAFYTYVYIACPSLDALSAAKALAKTTWQNENAMINPLQVLNLGDDEMQNMLTHAMGFAADVSMEVVGGMKEYKYCNVLLPKELTAFTHLPRVSEGGLFVEVADVPKFSVPSMLKGEIYMGTILSAERYTMQNGYRTPFEYRIDESELMHMYVTGSSRSGKTVAAMRFVAELSRVRRKKTGKRMRIVCMDPKQDWRGLAKYVEPERFRFYNMGNTLFRPLHLNPLKIPHGVNPQFWIDGVIDIYCRAYGLLERGKQMLGETIYQLYHEAGVFGYTEEQRRDLIFRYRKEWFDANGIEESGASAEQNARALEYAEEIVNRENEAIKQNKRPDLISEMSSHVTFVEVYNRMNLIKLSMEGDAEAENEIFRRTGQRSRGKSGNDTKDAYARLLDRLQAFNREFSVERQLFGTSEGISVDELIGEDDVTVLESKGLENTFRNFVFGVITSGFYKFALAHEGGFLAEDQYETLLVIEEANEVLTGSDVAGTGGGASFGMTGQSEFEQILDQSAGYGLFIMAITQKISDMPKSIIANSGLIFAGRLKIPDDITTVVRSVAREERYEDRDLVKWFPRAPTGWFICMSSRTFDFKDSEPILVQIQPLNFGQNVKNSEIEEIMSMKSIKEYMQNLA